MSKLSESVFYGVSHATKSDSSFFKLKNGATKKPVRATIPRSTRVTTRKKCDRSKKISIKDISYKPSPSTCDSPQNFEITSKKKCDRSKKTSKKDISYKPSPSTHDSPQNFEITSKKVKLESTPLSHDKSELSDYEKQIQNNIADRMKFLENLNIFDAKKSLEESIELTKIKRKPQKKEKIEKNKTPIMKRKSLRLQHLEAVKDTFPVEINSEFYEEEIFCPSPELKGPIDLQSYYKQENAKESSAFLSNLKNLKNFVKDKVHSSWNKSEKMIENILGALKCGEDDVIKVVPSSVCSIAFHPSIDKSIAFVGGKRGELGIFDIENIDLNCSEESSFYYNIHSGKVNCMTVDNNNSNILYTTSMDGTVRKLDLVTFQSERIYWCKEDEYISYHSQQDSNHLLVTGSKGCIELIDLRCWPLNVPRYKVTSNCNVKVVAVNPIQNQYFSTGGSDGYVRLWDVRSLEKDLSALSVGRSINGLEYTPITGKYLLTTSYQDIQLFKSPSPWEMIYKNKIQHNNNTGRWLRPFRASWLPRSENLFVIGSMDNPRRIEVWNSDGQLIKSLFGDALQSVSSINAFHPFKKILLGGNSSGRVHVFR